MKKNVYKTVILIVILLVITIGILISIVHVVFRSSYHPGIINGSVSVSNDLFVFSDFVECISHYKNKDINVALNSERIPNGISFINEDGGFSYTYTFALCSKDITIYPVISFGMVSDDNASWSVNYDIYKVDDQWDAIVSCKSGTSVTSVECKDIENNGLNIHFTSEGAGNVIDVF